MALLRHLFRRQEDPYAGADLATAKRIGGLLWLVGAVISTALTPLAPPTAAIGALGWAPWTAGALLSALGARRLLRQGEAVPANLLLAMAYASLVQVAMLDWLAGGNEAPYHHLYLLSAVFVAATHPPRRAAAFLGCLWIATCAPLAYDGLGIVQFGESISELLVLTMMSFAAMVLMDGVRAQRVASREEGEEARQLARVDAGTGLLNRRALEEALEREVTGSRSAGTPLSIVVIDLDDFKAVNDGWGHVAGDECLRDVAEAIRNAVRSPDACFRWAGDEFAVLLPGAGIADAIRVGERVSGAVSEHCRRPDGEPVTLCYGTAELLDEVDGAALLDSADRALLGAKAARGQADAESPAPSSVQRFTR